ncbi:unnamed protein product [Orchesella dallaii]|uniref:C2H2-type domain-containing protein n=1 Tax=Orchesella dallaii TaxID=48710 RepID=A0ABP1RMY5_9HEXA
MAFESMNQIIKKEVQSNDVVSIEQEDLSADIPPLLIDLTNLDSEINGTASHSSSLPSGRFAPQNSSYVPTNPPHDSEMRALLNFMGKQEDTNDKLFEQLRNLKEETRMEMEAKDNQIMCLKGDIDQLKEILEKNGISLEDIKKNRQQQSGKRKQSVEVEMEGEQKNVKRIRKENTSAENQSESEGTQEETALVTYYQVDFPASEEAKYDDDDDDEWHHENTRNLRATGTFECLEWNCMLVFDDKSLRNLHLNTAHGYLMDGDGTFRCTTEACGNIFVCLESCWEHKISEHQ